MAVTKRQIEVDETTAAALEDRAAREGVTVSELLGRLAKLGETPAGAGDADIVELDRRWAALTSDGTTVDNADVVRWLQTWGTPGFKPWHERRAASQGGERQP